MEGIDVTEPAPFLQLFGGVVGIAFALIRIGKWSLTFSTITLPSSIYHVLHYSLTLRLSFPILLLCLILCGIGIMLGLRYGYWNRYEKYRGDPIHKNENAYHFHPDVAAESTDEDRSGFHWYLDEFLQAIRIFGFLERPVFHELARHLQTRRLVAGEVLSLDKDTSFYIVVEGHVQVFAPIENKANAISTECLSSDIGNGYQLINEVVSGGTLSSLFTILRLFTENVQLGFKFDSQPDQNNADEGDSPPPTARPDLPRSALSSLRQPSIPRGSPATVLDAPPLSDSHISPLNIPPRSDLNESFLTNVSSNAGHDSAPISPLLSAAGSNSGPSAASMSASASHIHSEEHRSGSMARATVDTTLAVLPAEAFRRLTSKYPSAVAHIVQVILTRLARVTFHTAHQYLGLTREVMKTEQAINEYGKVFLPSSFYEKSAIETLWRRFPPSQAPAWQPSSTQSPAAANTNAQQATTAPKRPVNMFERKLSATGGDFYQTPLATRHQNVAPGDLFSMVESPIEDFPMDTHLQTSARRSISVAGNGGEMDTAPLDLREQVMNCIASSIGLTQPVIDKVPGILTSPSLAPQNSSNLRSSYDVAFSRLSRLDAVTASEDSESISQSASTQMSSSIDSAENGVEIRHFPAGTTVVHAGEQDAGLFYVIDGFIDIMLPLDELDKSSKPKSRRTSQSFGSPLSTPRPNNDLSSPFTAEKSSPRPSPVGNALDDTLPFGAYKRKKSRIAVEEAYRRSKQHEADSARSLYTIGRGGIAGYLSSLLGVPSYVDIVAKTDVYVGFLPVRALERLVEKRNYALLTLSKRLLSLLPNLIIHIDAALDWQQVDAGQVIFREGDVSDSFYIVINGRLRAITERKSDGSIEIVSEYSQGDSAGELDMITKSPRTKTLHSIRDSEVARMPTTLFNAISIWHPPITIQISRIIARRVRREMDERQRNSLLSLPKHISGVNDLGRSTTNFKTVALLPTTAQVPIIDFARRLQTTFAATITGSTVFLNQSSVMQALGRHAFKRMGKLKLAGWLANQEQNHRLVLYVVDTTVGSLWAQTSIRQADCILLVGFGDDPRVGEFERLLLSIKTTARKELVLLHPERSVVPGTTREWLKPRPWVSAHHHIEMPGLKRPTATSSASTTSSTDPRPVKALRSLKQRLETRIGRVKSQAPTATSRPPHLTDFARLARRLCGTSIGLVLGGGGARGSAHVGALRALEERGVPVDLVGGTSIGSFVGGLYARDGAAVSSHGRAKRFAGRMASLWRFITDATYPLVSYTTGHEFNRGIFKCFADTHIEDMWLPFFCNTTNITWSRMEVHSSGYAWRYIRGSMTLAGLVPPLIDEGNMLVDGGYTDNLPVSIMLAMGARNVIAIDVGGIDDTSPQHYGDTLSGWLVLLNRFNPWSSMRNIPSIPDIQTRLTYTTSVKMLEEVKSLESCLYLRMPVEHYGTLEFGKYSEILQVGYDTMTEAIKEWESAGRLPTGVEFEAQQRSQGRKRGIAARRNSI